jgi:hypothetical protein
LGKPAPKVKWYRIMEENLLEGNSVTFIFYQNIPNLYSYKMVS